MNVDNIQRLIDILNDSPGVTELAVTAPDGAKIAIRRDQAHLPHAGALAELPAEHFAAHHEIFDEAEEAGRDQGPELQTVAATMVGLFHAAKPPLTTGASVNVGQIVGYIESMKLMNEIASSGGGIVSEVLIDENQPVEYGQPLMRLTSRSED